MTLSWDEYIHRLGDCPAARALRRIYHRLSEPNTPRPRRGRYEPPPFPEIIRVDRRPSNRSK